MDLSAPDETGTVASVIPAGVNDDDQPGDDQPGDGRRSGPLGGIDIERFVTWIIVAASCGFVFYSLHPELILASTTPTGGDMGAHVWGPPFLRDHLLGQFRLSGWTQDWYAGFPTYLFYMVVPSLLILLVSAGPPLWVAVPLIAGVILAAYRSIPAIRVPWLRHLATGATVVVSIGLFPVPYNIAFKLVAVLGLVTLPIAACALARSLRAPFPVPPLVALATLPYIYDKGFTILGGNGASTMAGEFAFSISLSLAIFYLAALFAGERDGRWRAPGALLLAFTVLCHIIPAIFAVIVTVVVVPILRRDTEDPPTPSAPDPGPAGPAAPIPAARIPAAPTPAATFPTEQFPGSQQPVDAGQSETRDSDPDARPDGPWWTRSLPGAVIAALVIAVLLVLLLLDRTWLTHTGNHDAGADGLGHWQFLFPAGASLAALAFFTGFDVRPAARVTSRWGSLVAIVLTIGLGVAIILRPSNWGVVAALVFLAAVFFVDINWRGVRWVLAVAPVAALVTAIWMLPFLSASTYMNDMGWEKYTRYWDYLLAVPELDSGGMPLRSLVLVAAGLGLVLSVLMRVRLGWFLGLVVLIFAWLFRYFPQYRLWNARLLPFYFLALYMLAGLAIALIIRFAAEVLFGAEARRDARRVTRSVSAVVAAAVLFIALLGSFKVLPGGRVVSDPKKPGTSVFRWAGINFPLGIVPDWASWNFSGIERKPAYPEFRGIIDMMSNVGATSGCGRAFWEFDPDLNRFGTTMSLMLLPYYTNGCIASMEGLYFEASTTTPFHFLMQSALSASPSRAQRDMPYTGFDLDLGIQQMQLLGVRYYMASSDMAIEAAEGDPRLEKIADQKLGTGSDQHRWVVFEVRSTARDGLVVGLENKPVVLTDANDHIDGWVYQKDRLPPTEAQAEAGNPGTKTAGPAVTWFMDPSRWNVFLATSGPRSWPRATADTAHTVARANPAVSVSNVHILDSSVSFDVDRVGVPVLVKVSYFPNWRAKGANGPYRVSPNLMVVVPTGRHVELSYGYSEADLVGAGTTLLGLAGVVALAVADERRRIRVAEAAAQQVESAAVSDADPADPAPGPTPEG